jgi:hypothetical protein
MKEISNRSPVIVVPKGPFKEWAKLYNEISDEDLSQRLKEIHVYLVDWAYNEKQEEVLKPYYRKIFEYELLSWNKIKSEWPPKRNYKLFLEWFEVKVGDDLFDLETEIIQAEEL